MHIPKVDPMSKYLHLFDRFDEKWIAEKIYLKLKKHMESYGTFNHGEQYVEYCLSLPYNVQKREVYMPISTWNKSRRKTESFIKLADKTG